jgi:hypothetical protein
MASDRRVRARLLTLIVVGVIALVTLAAAPGAAHWRTGVSISVGPYWWGPPYWAYAPYWPYSPYWPHSPYWYPPPSHVYPPPPVIAEEPPVYIQQPPPQVSTPPPPSGPYWYYCPSAGGYYPSVPACPEAWIRVPPRPE